MDTYLYGYVMTNLKTISHLEMNKKIIVRNGFIILDESPVVVQSFKRWFMGDNRSESIQFVKTTFHNAFQLYQNHIAQHKVKPDETLLHGMFSIREALIEACNGVENLSKTYYGDASTKSVVLVLLDLIQTHIKTIDAYLLENRFRMNDND